MYEEIPLSDFKQVFRNYMGCWRTLVFAGVLIDEGQHFSPVSIQIWASDNTEEQTEVIRFPRVPQAVCMLKITRGLSKAWPIVDNILDKKHIQVDGLQISFEKFEFARAAFLSSGNHEPLYPKELHKYVDIWPKLFLEGTFSNRDYLFNDFSKKIEEQFQKGIYGFPSLQDASNHLIGIRVSANYYWGVLCAALKIPIKVRASVTGLRLKYGIELPESLRAGPKEMYYVAESESGVRHESISLPEGKRIGSSIIISSRVNLKPTDRIREVVLRLGDKRVDSVIIPRVELSSETVPTSRGKVMTAISNKVFVAHGQDEGMKQAVARTLETLELAPVILHEQPDQGRTIIEKFVDYSDVSFAIVLLSPDDVAYPKDASPEQRKLRARQNVILELGFFLGKLGRKKVLALYKEDENFEMPSDYSGVLYTPYDSAGTWRFKLVQELNACGFEVDANKLLKTT